MQVSIVIVNYNVRDLLLNAVASIRQGMDGIEGEIIVVDNASTDGAVDALNRLHPDVITIPLDRNLGFGAANNIGIDRAVGDYILILNPDTLLGEDTLRRMIQFMEEHPEAGTVGCKIILPDGSLDPAAKRGFPSPWSSFSRVFGLSRLFPKSRLFGGYNLTWLDPELTVEVESICGCFMFYRADVLKKIGGFDTDYFMYGEDLDLCWRTKQSGWEVWYSAETSIVHTKGESTRRSSLDAIAMFYDAMEVFARKHFRRNLPLLYMVRLGIVLRRGLARFNRRFPHAELALIDICAVLIGLCCATLVRNGNLNFPAPTVPWVFIAPPIPFLAMIAMAGGYGPNYANTSRILIGYLGGFFALSTLPYFFEAYRFSRAIVLGTTGIATLIGLSGRIIYSLIRRTVGRESSRRIGIIGSETITPQLRGQMRRLFLGRPVNVVGVIAPTFRQLDGLRDQGIGTIDNVAQTVHLRDLTDIVVVDPTIGYNDVMRALRNCDGEQVRFHVLRSEGETTSEEINSNGSFRPAREPYTMGPPLTKRLQDMFLSIICLLLFPFIGPLRRGGTALLGELFQAGVGLRPLVGGTERSDEQRGPIFAASSLYSDQPIEISEVHEIERYYRSNRSLILDCEIVITALRKRRRNTDSTNAVVHLNDGG